MRVYHIRQGNGRLSTASVDRIFQNVLSLIFTSFCNPHRFSDQYDNAQRLSEKGFGIRLDPHNFTADQLVGAIEQLLADQKLKERLTAVAERIKRERSKDRACLRIEAMVADFKEAAQQKMI